MGCHIRHNSHEVIFIMARRFQLALFQKSDLKGVSLSWPWSWPKFLRVLTFPRLHLFYISWLSSLRSMCLGWCVWGVWVIQINISSTMRFIETSYLVYMYTHSQGIARGLVEKEKNSNQRSFWMFWEIVLRLSNSGAAFRIRFFFLNVNAPSSIFSWKLSFLQANKYCILAFTIVSFSTRPFSSSWSALLRRWLMVVSSEKRKHTH